MILEEISAATATLAGPVLPLFWVKQPERDDWRIVIGCELRCSIVRERVLARLAQYGLREHFESIDFHRSNTAEYKRLRELSLENALGYYA